MATEPKKRKYMDSYIEYGFTVVRNSGIEKAQCVICCDMLSGESMKPSKLERHLETRHPEYLEKDPSFFKKGRCFKTVKTGHNRCLSPSYLHMLFRYELQEQGSLIRLERISSSLVRRIWSDLFWAMSMLRSYHQFPYLTTLFIDVFLRCQTIF